MQRGSRSIHLGSCNKGETNAVENNKILEGKVLEYMRELTGGEAAAKWASWPNPMPSHRDLSHIGFLCLSNPEEYATVLRFVIRRA